MALDIETTQFGPISSMGMRTFGVGGIQPFPGKYLYVDETFGSDGNPGTADNPLATLSAAHSLCTANKNDVVFFTGTIHQTSSLVWSKAQTHLIGLCAPIRRGKRARISVSGSTGFNKLIQVTGAGCYFANFGTYFGWDDSSTSLLAISQEAQRCCWDNVEILGFGSLTAVTGTEDLTGARALKMSGAAETTFRDCVFGVDTTTRNVTNYTVEFATAASPRVTFSNCDFEAYLGSSGAASCHLLVGTGAIDRYLKFEGCRFMNSVKSAGTAMTAAFLVQASAGGLVLLDDCEAVGITDWEATASNQVFVNMPAPSAGAGGLAINNTV